MPHDTFIAESDYTVGDVFYYDATEYHYFPNIHQVGTPLTVRQ